MNIVPVMWESRCVASFGDVGPVEGNGRKAFGDVTLGNRYVGGELKQIFCFWKLKRCLRGKWSNRSKVINDSVFFKPFSVFDLPCIECLADVFVVDIDGDASLNFFVEGIGLDVFEFCRRKAR